MLRILNTIQKKEKLNNVFAYDEKGSGGANHEYLICKKGSETKITTIQFQKGARKEKGSISGVLDCDLLEIVRDRLKSFQAGEFSSDYNQLALEGVENALYWLNKRVEDRTRRKVLGKEEK